MAASTDMKIAVLNYSGNVGKSTLARHLLQPRMGDCPIMFIESINEGGDESNIKGKEFASVMIDVLTADKAIVDIGSSNIEAVFAKVSRMGEVLEGFDFFLIPTVAKPKQQKDTVKVIRDLISLGVPKEKLKVVFNHVDPEDDVERSFAAVKEPIDALGITSAVVYESEGYAHLGTMSVKDCASEGRDFRKEIAAAKTTTEKHELATAKVLSLLAQGIQKDLDKAFATLFPAAA